MSRLEQMVSRPPRVRRSVSIVISVNTTDANPAGPNHPTNATGDASEPARRGRRQPAAILMRVRLRIAKTARPDRIGPSTRGRRRGAEDEPHEERGVQPGPSP